MNKKLLTFGFLGIFMIGLVAAAVLTYYGSVEQDISIESPIVVGGNDPVLIEGYAGTSFPGEDISVTNEAPFSVGVLVSNDAPEGVEVEYTGTTTLHQKVVDFGNSPWSLTGLSVEVEYTVVGDEFHAEVTSPVGGYELVYYKDNSDRFNNPATAIGVDDVSGNLPYAEDGNADEYDMCVIEGYSNCHGAKLWYVPSDALTQGEVDWSRASEFYFETNLIQYNAEGELDMYSELTLSPVYTIDASYVGEDTVTTTIA